MVTNILHNKITVQSGGYGQAFADPDYAGDGQSITLRAVPETGYKLYEWQVVSGSIKIADPKVNPATFKMTNHPVTVKAFFKELVLTITDAVIPDAAYSYSQPAPVTVTITNTGDISAFVKSIVVDDFGENRFFLTGEDLIDTIQPGESTSFYVQPVTGLDAGTYNAAIIVSYTTTDNDIETIQSTVSFFVDKAEGAVVDEATVVHGLPALGSVTIEDVYILVNPNPGNQSTEYAVSTASGADADTLAWQSSTTFTGLSSSTDYYFYARAAETANYYAGDYSISAAIRFYAVSFEGNGNVSGTAPVPMAALPNEAITLPEWGNLFKTASTFGSWNTLANASGENYAPGDSYTVTKDQIFYVRWFDAQTFEFNIDILADKSITIASNITISQTDMWSPSGTIPSVDYIIITNANEFDAIDWVYDEYTLTAEAGEPGKLKLNARDIHYNQPGIHFVDVRVWKDGVPYGYFKIEFTVVN